MENREREIRLQLEAWEQSVGSTIRVERMRRGWTQAELASRLAERGFSALQTTIAKIEGGSRPLRLSEFVAIAHALEMPWQSLLSAPDPLIHEDESLADMELRLTALRDQETVVKAYLAETVVQAAEEYAEARADRLAAEQLYKRIRGRGDGAPTDAAK